MIFLHGHYKFFRRRAAVRHVWCTVCKQPRLAVGHRSLLVIHLFWIPVLPVARVTDWSCASCGNNPKANLTARPSAMRRTLVLAGVLLVAGLWVLAETFLNRRDPLGGSDTSVADGFAGGVTLLIMGGIFGFMARRQLRRTAELGFDDGKTEVAPLSGDSCPLCGDLMLTRDNPRCERCQVDIQTR